MKLQFTGDGTWYHVEKIETEKKCNKLCVLGTYMSLLIYNEE